MKKVLFLALVAVVAIPSFASASFDVNLKLGVRSPEVVKLQNFLMDEGCFKSLPTGYFGPVTQRAVKCFQVKNKITPANGVFGPITRAKANGAKIVAVATVKPSPTVKPSVSPTPTPTVTPTPTPKITASAVMSLNFPQNFPTLEVNPTYCVDNVENIRFSVAGNTGMWDKVQIEVGIKRLDETTHSEIAEVSRKDLLEKPYFQRAAAGDVSFTFRYILGSSNVMAATGGKLTIAPCK